MLLRARWTSVALLTGALALAVVLGARGIWPFAGSFDGNGAAGTHPSGEATPEAHEGGSSSGSPGLRSNADARSEGSRTPVAAEPWELAVRVTRRPADQESAAVPWPARVRLTQRVGAAVEVLGEAAAGADGVAVLDLTPLRRIPPLAIESSVSVQVSAERSAPGERPVREWRDVRPPPEGPARLDIEVSLDEARLVRGRVLDGDGHPVGGAIVEAAGLDVGTIFEVRTDVEGQFDMVGPEPAHGTFRIVAQHPALGVAYSQPVAGESWDEVQLPDLVLAPSATIEGDVSWPDGAPAAGVEVHALRRREDPGTGLRRGSARTDRQGHFRLNATAGLVYEVGPLVEGDGVSCQLSTAGGPPLRFVLDAYRLRVRVRDVNGRPLPGMPVFVRRIPSECAVALARGELGDEPIPPYDRWQSWTIFEADGPQAEADILAPAGISLLVTAEADAFQLVEATVEGLGAAGERTIDLVLSPRSAVGTIRVEVSVNEGRAGHWIGYVLETLGGRDLLSGLLDGQGRIHGIVPPGSWALTLAPVSAQRLSEERSPLKYPRPWTDDLAVTRFPWRGLVRVGADRETRVTPTFRPGGRVRIRVEDGPGELAGTEIFARRKGTELDVPLRRFGRQAIPGGDTFWVGKGLARPQVTSEDLLEPGEYVLRFRPAGEGTPQDLPLVIRADEITEVVYEAR